MEHQRLRGLLAVLSRQYVKFGMLTRRRKLLKQDRVNQWYESITDENLEELIAAARKEIQNGILKSLTQ